MPRTLAAPSRMRRLLTGIRPAQRRDEVEIKAADAAVAATDQWTDPDGYRSPAGEVHAWARGTNQTLCGLALSRSRLGRVAHVQWGDVRPERGGDAHGGRWVCPRAAAAPGRRRDSRRWQRVD